MNSVMPQRLRTVPEIMYIYVLVFRWLFSGISRRVGMGRGLEGRREALRSIGGG